MSISLTQDDMQQLVSCLQAVEPFGLAQGRHDLVTGAFFSMPGGQALIGDLDLDGTPTGVAVRLLTTLAEREKLPGRDNLPDGGNALLVFLGYLRETYGDLGGNAVFVDDFLKNYSQRTARPGLVAAGLRPLTDDQYYTVDYSAQVDQLEDELEQVGSQPQLLMLCLVRANLQQAEDKFLGQVRDKILPETLRLDNTREAVQFIQADWPGTLDDLGALARQMQKTLGEKILGRRTNIELQQLRDSLARYPSPVMVSTSVLLDDLTVWGSPVLEKYLSFWQQWLPLGPTQRLFVFCFVEYDPAASPNLVSRLLRRTPTPAQTAVDRFVTALQGFKTAGVRPVVLKPIQGARLEEALKWVQRDEVAAHCQVAPVQKGLQDYYRQLNPGQKEANFAPLDGLVSKLKELITQYPAQTGG